MNQTLRIICAIVFIVNVAGIADAQHKIKPQTENSMRAYLMVYFKDADHSLHFALSKDGHSFTDVNNAKPVIAGDTIAEQKGIRDPYIYRAVDGMFYLALTDLHIYAQKVGLRNTEWEREKDKFGWGNNRGLVLMKSPDLIHWTHTVLRVDQAFSELSDIGCAWAPEMIYDDKKKKTMLYFTMRHGVGKEKVYFTYMNKDFTRMETVPKLLFDYPRPAAYIDADITKVGNQYHLFYTSHDGGAHIEQAISDSINTGYVYDNKRIDPEPRGCEAPTVYKLIGENRWILIYDIYSIKPHNFGFSETTNFINFKNLGHFNEGIMKATNFSIPKHPSVIQLSRQEAQRISAYWKSGLSF